MLFTLFLVTPSLVALPMGATPSKVPTNHDNVPAPQPEVSQDPFYHASFSLFSFNLMQRTIRKCQGHESWAFQVHVDGLIVPGSNKFVEDCSEREPMMMLVYYFLSAS